uniref:Uncharacterized protein n=1 Tax=Chromera velia CCMP2878 TaxID=1169474 RepID=A0A0G4HSI4_9ALVE|eukprot:Cvel_8243.t1-p1 / transcript=Cvel_8243.t1 / gene=Cvel_8243 / organism=Chromera_velia_CCMP2878 / gene_product=hypothetical protein / transcript_product=hypothetical protein / location=Cvel_scaffold451:848-2290(-) / protein_length=481 / sequence_SO=supercontig / SO=protein_coding / is_pseudo=false
MGALVKRMRDGGLSSLRTLKIEEAGPQGGGMKDLCSAFIDAKRARRNVAIETLSLSCKAARYDGDILFQVTRALSADAFPSLRNLEVASYRVGFDALKSLVGSLRDGSLSLPTLERLRLQNFYFEVTTRSSVSVMDLSAVLTKGFFPRLRVLDLQDVLVSAEGAAVLFRSLASDQAISLEALHLSVGSLSESLAQSICAGQYPFLQTFGVKYEAVIPFLKVAVSAEGPVPLSALDIVTGVNGIGEEGVRMIREGIVGGKISGCVRVMKFEGVHKSWAFGEESPLFEAFRSVPMPTLTFLQPPVTSVQPKSADSAYGALSEGMKRGNLPSLQRLYLLSDGREVGKAGIEALMEAALADRLLGLEELDLSEKRAVGEAAESLCAALGAGKLPKLRILNLKGCYLYDKGMVSFSDALRANDLIFLEQLFLEANGIGDEGVGLLAASLKPSSLPMLSELTLTNRLGTGKGEITAEGGSAFGRALS